MPEATRKLAAIVFTDIVGFTKLTARNEPAALALLETQRALLKPIVEAHGGEWLKELGDGLLLTFTTTTEAVDCSIEIQHTIKKVENLDLRIGIHQGEVVVSGGDVIGDDVNVASRIEPFAATGGVVVTEQVNASLLRDPVYQTKLIGKPALKGVLQDVTLHCITSHGLPETDISKVSAKLESSQLEQVSPLSQAIQDSQKPPSKTPMILGGAIIVIGLIVGFMFMGKDSGGSGESIAVLPFVNMSSDKENEYFSDGITEEILNYLAKIKGLRVISRTSVFTYKGRTDISIADIGRQLDVAHVLEGSVRKAGNKVRITAQLIRSKDDTHLWSETYDRELKDIFAVQDEIAQTIVGNLKMDYISHSGDAAPQTAETTVEAYNLYLQGIHFQDRRDEEGMRKALSFFKRTVREDPNYALAYVGLANTYLLLADYGYDSFDENLPLAEHNANKAMDLGPTLAEVHVTNAYVSMIRKNDPKITESYYLKAIQLNPNYATAYHWYSDFLRMVKKDFQQSLVFGESAKRLDPLSGIIRINLSNSYQALSQLTEAEEVLTSLLDLNPNFSKAYGSLALIYRRQAEWDKAIKTTKTWIKVNPNDGNSFRSLGEINMIMGMHDEAIDAFNSYLKLNDNSPIPFEFLAFTYYLKKDFIQAKSFIEQGYEIAPFTPLSRMVEGWMWIFDENYENALTAFDDSQKGFFGLSSFFEALALTGKGIVYAKQGHITEAERIITDLDTFGTADGIQSLKGIILLYLDKIDEGFAIMKQDIEEQNPYIYIKSDPLLDPFKHLPQHNELIKLYKLN